MQHGFDLSKLYPEAQSRWLKPSEVLYILQNYEQCQISPEPPDKPPNGSLFLFNRRVLRFFRKDGHVWQRKKDGRTVSEAHVRLKVGNIDALSCYYAHGEENPYFQRRSYWMLDLAYEHIVLVHYREVMEGRYMPSPSTNSLTFNQSTSVGDAQGQGTCHSSSYTPVSVEEMGSELTVRTKINDLVVNDKSEPPPSQGNQTPGMPESELILDDDDCQISEGKLPPHVTLENMQSHINCGGENPICDACGSVDSASECIRNNYHFAGDVTRQHQTAISMLLPSTGDEHFPRGDNQKQPLQPLHSVCMFQKKASPFGKEMLDLTSTNSARLGTQERTSNSSVPVVHLSAGSVQAPENELFADNDMKLASSEMGNQLSGSCGQQENFICQKIDFGGNNEDNRTKIYHDSESNLQLQLSAARIPLGFDNAIELPMSAKQLQEVEVIPYYPQKSICDTNFMMPSKENSIEWMDNMQLAVENAVCTANFSETLFDQSQFIAPLVADSSLTLAQKQLFSIREVSPEWAFSSESTKVIITGDFLCSNYLDIDWKVLFGDIEVSVEIIQKGVIRCHAPPHVAGRVSLCVTSGNRESCSEVRDFEYCMKPETSSSESNLQRASEIKSGDELLLVTRFAQILLCRSDATFSQKDDYDVSQDPLRKLKTTDDQWAQVIESVSAGRDDTSGTIYWVLQELLKDKLKRWLSSTNQENAVEVCSLSRQEQSIIHMISGLGFEWALCPILNAGVGVNYRDLNGWTALHWAARFGREKMVAALLAAGASAGAVTDPTTEDPVGKTPASIAASNGHKGLAGYLSEVALTSHLSSLTLAEIEISRDSAELVAERVVESISERNVHVSAGATEDQLSLKDSLAAVRNAAQAAARIQSAFRAHSFRKKQQKAAQTHCEIHELAAASKLLHGHHDQKFHTAAVCIQKKYRGWKGHKNYLTLCKHVVKIQAYVRGHQVRKMYKEFLWTASVLEKAILRWRRGGVGLRGFKVESESIDEMDGEDILKTFRKQKVDAALHEAVSSVLSMVESPDARQQYRRMLVSYRLAKAKLENAGKATSRVPSDFRRRDASDEAVTHLTLDEAWADLDAITREQMTK